MPLWRVLVAHCSRRLPCILRQTSFFDQILYPHCPNSIVRKHSIYDQPIGRSHDELPIPCSYCRLDFISVRHTNRMSGFQVLQLLSTASPLCHDHTSRFRLPTPFSSFPPFGFLPYTPLIPQLHLMSFMLHSLRPFSTYQISLHKVRPRSTSKQSP